jgi:hypothetical protein
MTIFLRPICLCALVGIVALNSQLAAIAQEKKTDAKSESSSPRTFQENKKQAEPTDPLLEKVEEAIEISKRRYLTAGVHSPWQIFHGMLALKQDYLIKQNDKKISALDWMSQGVSFRGDPWFQKTRHGGRVHPYTVPYAFEGHPNQSLAILAFANVPMDHKFGTPNGTITTADMVKHAQMEVNSQEEITWSLWALIHYLGPDARWQNQYGRQWSIEHLVRIQTDEQCNDAACGGTHGLFALAYARNTYLQKGRPLRGVWLEADQKIRRYVEAARSLQNSDGTFSTDFFRSGSHSYDFENRLETSGHTLEFLMLALPHDRLKEQWVRRSVSAIATDLIEHRRESIECAPLYHALNGLVIYRDRVAPQPAPQLAGNSSSKIDVEVHKPVLPPLPPEPKFDKKKTEKN